jgi:hypothetical protein
MPRSQPKSLTTLRGSVKPSTKRLNCREPDLQTTLMVSTRPVQIADCWAQQTGVHRMDGSNCLVTIYLERKRRLYTTLMPEAALFSWDLPS